MTFVGALAIFFCMAAIPIGFKRITNRDLMIGMLLLAAHVTTAIFYYVYSQSAAADAFGYYYDTMDMHFQKFSVGTVAMFKLVYFLKTYLNASYLDCYMIFQTFGFLGILILCRCFQEIQEKVQVPYRSEYIALLFLPSVNFWSCAIGKDAPLFFAISLCVWSMLKLGQRFLYACAGLGVMVFFRAHIALLATSAVAAAAFFERSTTLGRKLGLLCLALVGTGLVLGPAMRAINFDQASTPSIASYVEQQQSIYATAGGGTAVVNASLPMRILSLLFRPFFFDAHGFLGLVASVENLAVVIASLYALVRWRDIAHLVRRVLFVRFLLIYAAVLLFSLALVYYNVGLGLRERTMAYPMVFCLLVALWAYRRKIAIPAGAQVRRAVLVPANMQKPAPEL